jgi:hypothetical protein
MTKMICRICTNAENNREFRVREIMFGFRDEVSYFECSRCGCLQIAEIPNSGRVPRAIPVGIYEIWKSTIHQTITRFRKLRNMVPAIS